MKADLDKHIGKIYEDIKVLSIFKEESNWYKTKFNVKCMVCGSEFIRTGQVLYKNPKHNRFCYSGFKEDLLWKDMYSKRFSNILSRCKNNKYYENIECEFTFYELIEEIIKIQNEKKLTDKEVMELTIDRIDNKGNYKVGNLRLVNMTTQIYNRRVKPNYFVASKGEDIVISNSSKLFSEYINCLVGGVNNTIAGRSKTCKGFTVKKITKKEYIKMKSVTTKAKIIHKNYE